MYQDIEHGFRIKLPENWSVVTPRLSLTHLKARAPKDYASLGIGSKDGLFPDDTSAQNCEDAWTALDKITVARFDEVFERNMEQYTRDHLRVKKTQFKTHRAIKVDYAITSHATKKSVRIRALHLIHAAKWYSLAYATHTTNPNHCLREVLEAVATFEFVDKPPLLPRRWWQKILG